MRLLRLALIPSLACVLSCSSTTEERLATQPNPVQPVLGNPVMFPSAPGSAIVATPTPSATPSPSASPDPRTPTPRPDVTATPRPTATPSPAAPDVTVTPVPTRAATATPAASTPTPAASPTAPSPTATPQAGTGGIHHIRVGFFGISCKKNGKPVPNNGAKQLPAGCKGFVTATPKYANGDDVPLSVHGPDIDWDLEYGDNIVEVRDPSFPSDFNKDVVGVRPGIFNLCATVRGVKGCLDGTVTP